MIYFHYIILFCLFYLLVFYFLFFKHAWFLVIQVELWEGENWRSINYGVLLAGVLVTPWIIVFCRKRIWSFLSNDWIPFEKGILHFHCGISNSNRCRRYIYSIWSIFNSLIEWNCVGSIQTKVTCFHHICKWNVQFIYALFKLH